MIAEFENIARAIIGVKSLKIIGFGPRPYDFLACNAQLNHCLTLVLMFRKILNLIYWLHLMNMKAILG